MKIDSLNYNQLKVLLAVYKHGQGSLAAAELGISSCAVTRTLNALRDVFMDSLFVRKSNGLIPTQKTEELIPHAKLLVEQYQLLERQHSVFSPSQSGGHFVIRAYDEFVYAVHKVIDNYILPEAPNLRFDIRTLSHDCSNELIGGGVDFVVVYEGFDDTRLNYEIFSETGDIYILARKDHPILSESMSLEQLSHYPLLEIDNYNDLTCPLLVNLCRDNGLQMDVAGYTDSVATAMQILAESDNITLSCNQFTRKFVDMLPAVSYRRLSDNMIENIKEIRSEHRTVGNYILYGNINNSPAFNWVKSKLVYGLEREWRLAAAT
ncbi:MULTISPECIES: LysR family transcriptional regulator [Shewanella]|jgi:DNA-binding transcriptional LysR family regulator|uniref:Nodulation protein D 2 n=3 Tax=Bacteria TaxID=2 RepID=A0A2T3GXG4_9GAMM|nr:MULTISPECIES: LysR family transcriptional regulator [Shewanella]AYV12082.1 LysR family transcriptional regulator [Shewanella algae]EKT4487353.1 LysR family transcriptional regulator [Shewanella algae]MBC8797526.1 LysR family transcriptional regulator [Shewanella algae]MBO2546511.1 LysR family transcriptional regulator [Shewanella algae]MBO2550679.1 LysR family transcriptional regulator [Shewanella algae]